MGPELLLIPILGQEVPGEGGLTEGLENGGDEVPVRRSPLPEVAGPFSVLEVGAKDNSEP